MAWGEAYVKQFLEISLPALISPDNLPALTEHFSVTLVFVTETRLFDVVRTHRAYANAENICAIKLIALDDLVATKDAYGMSITYALYRGFEDLGASMTECYQLFLNSDFVLANGSYRGLLPYLLRGDRLILAPSYCANSEEILPQILAAKDIEHGHMSISKRKLAEIILKNRHLTIRTKTINQQLYSANIIDQFYWAVDETTLLGYQLPVAVVAMKPERQPPEINSYWDYGLIAEFCPSQEFTVISDSDDFLMMELRECDRARGEVQLGWPSPKEIAYGLRNVATGYTVAAGQNQLILHSMDVDSDSVETGYFELKKFFDEVVTHLHPISSHLDHLQWVIHHPRFHQARKEFLENISRSSSVARVASPISNNIVPISACSSSPETHKIIRAHDHSIDAQPTITPADDISCNSSIPVRIRSGAITSEFYAAAQDLFPEEQVMESYLDNHLGGVNVFLQVGAIRSLIQDEFNDLRKLIGESGNIKNVELSLGRVNEIGHSISRFELASGVLGSFIGNMLAFEVQWYKHEFDLLQSDLQRLTNTGQGLCEDDVSGLRLPSPEQKRFGIWNSIFGYAPNFKPLHTLYSPTLRARSMANRSISNSKKILNIKGQTSINLALVEDCQKIVHSISINGLSKLTESTNGHIFDSCIVETRLEDLSRLSSIYDCVRPFLRPGGDMVLLFLSPTGERLSLSKNYLVDNLLPVCGPMEIYVSGNIFQILALRVKHLPTRLLSFAQNNRLFGMASNAFGTIIASPFSLMGLVFSEYNQDLRGKLHKNIASVTIRIQIG